MTYSDQSQWPNADGNGSYLELINPLSDNSIPSNWTASKNTIVSVKEAENNISLKIYPTPVKEFLTIESSGTIKFLQLYDFHGKLLCRKDINSGIYILDMSSYPKGIFLVQVFTTDRNFVQRIIKE